MRTLSEYEVVKILNKIEVEYAQNMKFREQLKEAADEKDRLAELKHLLEKIETTEDNSQILGNL